MTDVLKTPRTGEEVSKAVVGRCPVYLYSDLVRCMKEKGAFRTLKWLFHISPKMIILLQDPKKMNSGHWVSLSINPRLNTIYFFSSYGGKPDVEKNEWVSNDDLIRSNQDGNILNDGLKEFAKLGWEVHYNEFPYQIVGDKTATCGIWCVAFLNSDMNPTEFGVFNKLHNLSAIDYFDAYFKKE